ncbi:hypothetical protein EHS39_36795 [Ensifer sp. MPMI2T]|nr:hypothetical protein EHS39_36795 [Ensifer sp. MPMI2T]
MGAAVTVVDFSQRMCDDLDHALEGRVAVIRHDILREAPNELVGIFDYVISDRIVNRFTHDEFLYASKTLASFLAPGGCLGLGVKLGLETIDQQLMAAAKANNVQTSDFWDAGTSTIDYTAARSLLEKVDFDYGVVPREVILNWFDQRGREGRYSEADVGSVFRWRAFKTMEFPDTPATKVFSFEREH